MVYISLQEASSQCPYSQEYLSLRARQGKLKALKLGRNWVCTKEWVQEYIEKAEDYKKKESRVVALEPPRNLPIYAPDAEMWEDGIPGDVERQQDFQRKFQFAFAIALVVALLCGSIFQGYEQVFQVAGKVSPAVISVAVSLQDGIRTKGFALGSELNSYLGAGVGDIAKNYVAWLGEQVRRIAKAFVPISPSPRGFVVVPSSEDNEKLKEEIMQSFSDEVYVTPHDAETGIITPVFRKRAGEDYLYILVPLKNAQ